MSKAKIAFHSVLWNHAGKLLEYLLMYLTSIVIARGLGVEGNGRFVGFFSLSQLLLVLCSFGLETSLNKFIPQLAEAKHNEQAGYILRKALLLRGAAFVGVALLFYVVLQIFVIPFFSNAGQVLLIVVAFTGIRSIFPLFVAMLTAQLRTALTSMINLVVRSIEMIGVSVLAFTGMTVENLFLLFASTSAVHVVAYAIFCRSSLFGGVEPVNIKPVVAFGGVFWINTIVDFVLGRQGDILFLSNLLPNSSQAGLYDVAFSIAQLATLSMTVGLTGVSFATFAKLAVTNRETMDRFYSFSIRMISLLTIPVYAFLLFNAGAVVGILYSPHYAAAASFVQGILAFRIISRVFGGAENSEYLLSHGRVGTVVRYGFIAAATNILLNVLLIPRLEGNGSVIASGCANLLVNALTAIAVYRSSSNSIQIIFWLKLSVMSLVASFLSAQILPFETLLSLIGSVSLYALILIVQFATIKPLRSSDTEWLSRIDSRLNVLLQRFTRAELSVMQ